MEPWDAVLGGRAQGSAGGGVVQGPAGRVCAGCCGVRTLSRSMPDLDIIWG